MNCPWHASLDKAAYASAALVEYLDSQQGFAAPRIRWQFQNRSLFAYRLPNAGFGNDLWEQAEADWLGAVLAKIAQRGLPAPCSLDLERHILSQAYRAGILEHREESQGGAYRFKLTPTPAFRQDFQDFCIAALYPELLVDDHECQELIARYTSPSVSSGLEKDLFDRLRACFSEPRLALFVVPQRYIGSLISNAANNVERPDFAVEIPSPLDKTTTRIILEADDRTHLEPVQIQIDNRRNQKLFAAKFRVERFRTWESGLKVEIQHARSWEKQRWNAGIQQVAADIEQAIPPAVLAAAQRLRALPPEVKHAFLDLVALPVLEAQLTVVLAHSIRRYRHARLAVMAPSEGLAPVIAAVNATLSQLSTLASLKFTGHIAQAETDTAFSVTIASQPSAAIWRAFDVEQGFLAPAPLRHDYLPALLAARPRPLTIDSESASLKALLGNLFRKTEFREGQWPIVARALSLRPVVGLLPTGAGKSLCYQMAALLQPGFTVVVDPLRSLMLDQHNNLQAIGIHRSATIMSGASSIQEPTQRLQEGRCWFVFVAPERLQRQNFLVALTGIVGRIPVTYCVIDEAHCVSEWGHDFRPAYLNVGKRVRQYCVHDGLQPSLLALTGTASRMVLTDILKELGIDDQTALIEPQSFDRPELDFQIIRVTNPNRLSRLENILHSYNGESNGLVFTYFQKQVSASVDKIVQHLQNTSLVYPIHAYSGGEEEKLKVQKQFKRDEIPLLVCTHGFGMGIDKPNIRFVIHAMLPRSVEDYYQQAGRAGRDKKSARCIVLFVDEDDRRVADILDTEKTSPDQLRQLTDNRQDESRSDFARNLWFITNAFPDSLSEKKCLRHVIDKLDIESIDFQVLRQIGVDFSSEILPLNTRPRDYSRHLEKALYRLTLIGVVGDYTVSGTVENPRYEVALSETSSEKVRDRLRQYLAQYLIETDIPKFLPDALRGDLHSAAIQCGQKLIDFMYATVEKRRRTALGNMLKIARIGADYGPQAFRRELLAFLEESEFTQPIQAIAQALTPEAWFTVLDNVKGTDDITKLLGACRRQLQETPGHPGLLLLAGFCLLKSPYPDQARQQISQAFRGLAERLAPHERLKIGQRLHVFGKDFFANPVIESALLSGMILGDLCPELLDYVYLRAEPYSEAHHTALRILATRLLKTLKIGPDV